MELDASPVTLKTFAGDAIAPHIDDVARLRISVFSAFPYLYNGSDAYERDYLETYSKSPRALFVLAFDGDAVIGAATGMPLAEETAEVQAPFQNDGWRPASIFYFGESVLLPAYRGRGIGVEFFKLREAYAKSLDGMEWCAFCAVERPLNHPQRPDDHVPLDGFWSHRGYRHYPQLRTMFSWTDIGESVETDKPMSFWLRKLPS